MLVAEPDPLALAEPEQRGLDETTGGIDRRGRPRPHPAAGGGGRIGLVPEVEQRQRNRLGGGGLPRLAVLRPHAGTRHLVRGDDGSPGAREARRVQRAAHRARHRHVVERRVRVQLLADPDLPLGGRQRTPGRRSVIRCLVHRSFTCRPNEAPGRRFATVYRRRVVRVGRSPPGLQFAEPPSLPLRHDRAIAIDPLRLRGPRGRSVPRSALRPSTAHASRRDNARPTSTWQRPHATRHRTLREHRSFADAAASMSTGSPRPRRRPDARAVAAAPGGADPVLVTDGRGARAAGELRLAQRRG